MEKDTENRNAYYKARMNISSNRSEACSLLKTISYHQLEKFENERQKPTPEEVLEMAECFNEPNIRNYYCAHQCPIGELYVPDIELSDLSQTVLQVLAALNTVESEKDRLIEITSDGNIDDAEILDFIKIQQDLEKMSMVVDALQLWSEKMLDSGKIDKEKYEELRK